MIAWMARCTNDDCHTFDASTADWFKIGERGLQSGTIELGDWFQKTFSNWDGGPSLWSEMVPKGLRKGRYLVRHEIVSLHSANKPQFYPECAHLEVGGDGTEEPKEEYLSKIPGVWSMDRRFLFERELSISSLTHGRARDQHRYLCSWSIEPNGTDGTTCALMWTKIS